MTPPYDAMAGLARQALRVRGATWSPLPALLALTDPARTPDPLAVANSLLPGSALVYRHFGAPDREQVARDLGALCRRRQVLFLVSADPDLARKSGADGIHWPERCLPQAGAARARGDRRLYTAAAHGLRAARKARAAGVDAVLFSPVFPSASPSAGPARGHHAAAALARQAGLPVYALGGVNARTASRLAGLGLAGIACVGAIRSAGPTRT